VSHYGSHANDWFVGPGAAAAVHNAQMRNQVRAWQHQIWEHQAAANQAAAVQTATNETNGVDMAAQQEVTWDDVNAALLSGDPHLAQAGLAVVEEELGTEAAQETAQAVYDVYVEQHGEDIADGYLGALGYEVEDSEDAEEVLGEDLTEEQVADILDEELTRLEQEQGREFTREEVEAFVNHALNDDEGSETEADDIEQPMSEEEYEAAREQAFNDEVEQLETRLGRSVSHAEMTRMADHLGELSVEDAFNAFGQHAGDRVDEQRFGEDANFQMAPPSRSERVEAMTEKLTDNDPDHNLMLAAAQLADKHERQDAEYAQTGRLSADLVTAVETGDWSAVA
jgi:hypothetical protein